MKKQYYIYICCFLCWISICIPVYGKVQKEKVRSQFQYIEIFGVREGICITKYLGDKKNIVIPNKINGKPVTEIGDWAFANNKSVQKVTTPSGSFLKKIGKNAFSNCNNLQNVDFTSSQLEIVEENTFFECYMLKQARFPNNLKSIGARAFYNNTMLEEIDFGDGIEQIGAMTFYHCVRLTSIVLPKGIKQLSSIENEKEQGAVFYECTSLKSVSLGEGIKTIPEKTFYGCSALEILKLPNSTVEIGEKAFSYCTHLKEIHFPTQLKKIGYGAFYQCASLKILLFPETLQEIESSEYDGNSTFGKCIGLEEVVFGEKIQKIGNYLFEGCEQLKTVVLPASIEKIYAGAFKNCKELKAIYCLGGLPVVLPEAFANVNQKFAYYLTPNQDRREQPYSIKDYQFHEVMTTVNLFDKQGGNLVRSYYVKKNGYSFYPEEPKKKGYTFLYWNDSFTNQQWNWNVPIRGTTVLYPVWKTNRYSITFQTMGGEDKIKGKKVDYQEVIGSLPVPTRLEYEFQGWYTKENGRGTKVTEQTTMPAKNLTLYAKWKLSPRKPSKISIEGELIGSNQVRLLWNRIELADGYEIYRSLSKNGKYYKVATTSKQAKGYVNLGISIGNTYYYKVRAYRMYQGKKIYGDFSNIEKILVNGQPPQCILTGKIVNKENVELSWERVKDADGYVVFYKVGSAKQMKQLASFSDDIVGCYHKKLTKGKIYWYGVRAYSVVKGERKYGKMSTLIELSLE